MASGVASVGRQLLFLCIFAAVALISSKAYGAPVRGGIFELRQPHGATIAVRIWGDEFYQVVESLDGYTLIRDSDTGLICYARLSADGTELVSTGIRAGGSYKNLGIESHIRILPQAAGRKIRAARARSAARQMQTMDALGLAITPLGISAGNVQGICLLVDFPDEVIPTRPILSAVLSHSSTRLSSHFLKPSR